MRLASLLFVVAVTGCGEDHAHDVSAGDPCNDGGAYERYEVTDEACKAFVEAETRGLVVVDAAKAPAWTSPPTKVPAAPPPKLTWSKGTLARSPWKRLLKALHPIGEAWAHGDTTGDAFILTFKDGAGKELHRAMTINTDYTPAQTTWDKIRASKSFVVTLTGVRFTRNVIASGTKPTAAPPITITVE